MKVKYKWRQEHQRASLVITATKSQKQLEVVSLSLLQNSLYNNCLFTDPLKTGLWPSTDEYINC